MFFFSLICTNACVKENNMQKIPGEVNEGEARVRWSGNAGRSSKRKGRSSFEKDASEEDRVKADRILEDIEKSCQRMVRLLRVFDRMA